MTVNIEKKRSHFPVDSVRWKPVKTFTSLRDLQDLLDSFESN